MQLTNPRTWCSCLLGAAPALGGGSAHAASHTVLELESPRSSDQSRNRHLALGFSKPEGVVDVAGRWAGGWQCGGMKA